MGSSDIPVDRLSVIPDDAQAVGRFAYGIGLEMVDALDTYRGNPAILNYNPETGLVVVQSPAGQFISGWRLTEVQIANVLQYGKLGGG